MTCRFQLAHLRVFQIILGFFKDNTIFDCFGEYRGINVFAFCEGYKSRNFHRLTWSYSRLTAIWSGWLNIRVVLSNRLLSEQLPHYHPGTLSHTLDSALHSVQRWNLATGEIFGQWMGYENAGVGRLARDKARFGRSTHTTNLPTLLLKLSQLTCWWTLDGARLTSAYFHLTHLTPLTHSAQILMLTLLQFGCWPRHLETLQNN